MSPGAVAKRRLASFTDASLDFVIANHMLKHVEDPIAALEHQLRVLKPGGILYVSGVIWPID